MSYGDSLSAEWKFNSEEAILITKHIKLIFCIVFLFSYIIRCYSKPYLCIYVYIWWRRRPCCYPYYCWKWTWRVKLKILNEAVCILHSTDTFWKGMSNYSPSSYRKIVGQTGLFNFDIATCLEEGKFWIQICLTPFKNWSCVESWLCRGISKNTHTRTHTHTCVCMCVYIYIYIYTGVYYDVVVNVTWL